MPTLRIDLDVLQVEALELDLFLEALVKELDDLLAHVVARAREKAHLAHGLDEPVRVAPNDALEELRDALAHLRRELRDGPEIEQDEVAVARRRACSRGADRRGRRRRRRSCWQNTARADSPGLAIDPIASSAVVSPTFTPSTNVLVSITRAC
jgi:hypothetical protein